MAANQATLASWPDKQYIGRSVHAVPGSARNRLTAFLECSGLHEQHGERERHHFMWSHHRAGGPVQGGRCRHRRACGTRKLEGSADSRQHALVSCPVAAVNFPSNVLGPHLHKSCYNPGCATRTLEKQESMHCLMERRRSNTVILYASEAQVQDQYHSKSRRSA